jgi:hypothetical protein
MKLREAKVTAGCRCYSRACARWGEKGRGGRGESLIKDLKRKANSLSRVPGRPALLGWRGDPRPSKTAPIGMTKSARCGGGGGGGERLINDLKRQATRCHVAPSRPALRVGGGACSCPTCAGGRAHLLSIPRRLSHPGRPPVSTYSSLGSLNGSGLLACTSFALVSSIYCAL